MIPPIHHKIAKHWLAEAETAFGVTADQIRSHSHIPIIAKARRFSWRGMTMAGMSQSDIARVFKRNPSTICKALKRELA